MKRILLTAGTLLLLIFLLLHPQEGLAAARTGMTLWLNSLIPALLPFIILTGVLIHTGSIEKILLPFRPLFEFLLGVSVYGGYVFLLGMLCGYPMGAKLASDMYESHKISRREAEYLTTFCNNASPSFIITYLGQICLQNKVPASRLFLCLFLSDFICMMIFRLLIYRNHLPGSVSRYLLVSSLIDFLDTMIAVVHIAIPSSTPPTLPTRSSSTSTIVCGWEPGAMAWCDWTIRAM